jgi:hypothetical protein
MASNANIHILLFHFTIVIFIDTGLALMHNSSQIDIVCGRLIIGRQAYRKIAISNRICGVMVSVLASSAVDRGLEPGRVMPKTIKLVCVASPLSTQH